MKADFFKTPPNTKTRYFKTLLKLSVYGYESLHMYDEISMFLTISTKMVLVKTYVNMKFKNQTGIFPK